MGNGSMKKKKCSAFDVLYSPKDGWTGNGQTPLSKIRQNPKIPPQTPSSLSKTTTHRGIAWRKAMPSSPHSNDNDDIDRRPVNGHDNEADNRPRKKSRSRRKSSSRDKERKHNKRQRQHRSKEKRKRKRRRYYSSDSSSSSSINDSSSSSESDDSSSYRRRRDHKRKKHRHKKRKKRSSSTKRRRRERKDGSEEERSVSSAPDNEKPNEINRDSMNAPSKVPQAEAPPPVDFPPKNTNNEANPPKRSRPMMVPMSKAEYEKQQSQVRQVYDPESGRYRMVRGTGEIIESIVSRADHQRINQQATRGDGASFSRSALAAVATKRSYQR